LIVDTQAYTLQLHNLILRPSPLVRAVAVAWRWAGLLLNVRGFMAA
jgi:hypothetical protein